MKSIMQVDVGGTRTRFFINNRLLAAAATDLSTLKNQIQRFSQRHRPAQLIVGLRGVWTPAERKKWHRLLAALAPTVRVMSDVELAHNMVFQGKPGIVLAAGTGCICYGRNSKGTSTRAGGLGPLIGDEGSGFWIGKEYLKRVVLPNQKNGFQKVRRFIQHPQPIPHIASLAKKVIHLANQHPKSIEAAIMREARNHLNKLVSSVKKTLKEPSLPVIQTGSLRLKS